MMMRCMTCLDPVIKYGDIYNHATPETECVSFELWTDDDYLDCPVWGEFYRDSDLWVYDDEM